MERAFDAMYAGTDLQTVLAGKDATMKHLWPVLFLTVILGCQEPVPGSCYPNPAGGAGGADSVAVGVGVGAVGASSGDFISPPQNGPLDYSGDSNPCIMPQSPCDQNCQAESETRALGCGKIADGAQRAKCQEDNYYTYKSCRDKCVQVNDCMDRWAQQCDKAHDRCHANCTKNDPTSRCHDECNQVYGTCLKQCKKECE